MSARKLKARVFWSPWVWTRSTFGQPAGFCAHEQPGFVPAGAAGSGIEAILHYTCRDRNVLSMQSDLLGAAAGHSQPDHHHRRSTEDGQLSRRHGSVDVDAIGLVGIVHNLNRGLDIGGNPLGTGTSFVIGVGANPGVPNIDREIKPLGIKGGI
jgi:hypothetical protein